MLTSAALDKLALVVLQGPVPRSIPLPESGELTIGRGDDCDVQIRDAKLSRKHAVLRVRGGKVELEDLGSRNGTFVGGTRLHAKKPTTFLSTEVATIGAAALVLKHALTAEEASRLQGWDGDALPRPLGDARLSTMRRLDTVITKLARGDINVLIQGETGVGKEILAHTIHDRSPRASGPIVSINCAAISESLLEGELFGYERGAFTGAVASKAGLLESADHGTAFLDELGEMSPATQAKLLRVLESREVMRLGSLKPRAIDVRFVSATNRDLEREAEADRFRRDLYFRLAGATIELPPLRERTEEVASLAGLFVRSACEKVGRTPLELDEAALTFLIHYAWPGNIRELKNVMERAVLLCNGGRITLADLPCERMARRHVPATLRETEDDGSAELAELGAPITTTEPPAAGEREKIVAALEQCAGNQTRAARLLGIGRRTLIVRMDKYDLPRPRK
jgi:transcriptional regulator with GAF, ATPase, and Fis domain